MYFSHSLGVFGVADNESAIGKTKFSNPRWRIQYGGPMFDLKMYLSTAFSSTFNSKYISEPSFIRNSEFRYIIICFAQFGFECWDKRSF